MEHVHRKKIEEESSGGSVPSSPLQVHPSTGMDSLDTARASTSQGTDGLASFCSCGELSFGSHGVVRRERLRWSFD